MVQIGDMFVDGKNEHYNFKVVAIEHTDWSFFIEPVRKTTLYSPIKKTYGPRTLGDMLRNGYTYLPCTPVEVKEIDWI